MDITGDCYVDWSQLTINIIYMIYVHMLIFLCMQKLSVLGSW